MRLVVSTCDAFCHVMPLFFKYWELAWCRSKGHLFSDVMVLANTKKVAGPAVGVDSWCKKFSVFYTGVDEGWSNNMIKFLDQYYPDNTPMILMLDDYIMTKVNAELVNVCRHTIEDHDNVGMVRLVPIPGPTVPWHSHGGRSKYIGRLDKSTHESYCLSLQAAMWKPSVLRSLMDYDENPWQTENRGSRRAAAMGNVEFLCTYNHVVRYENYLKRGEIREKAAKWVKDHPNGLVEVSNAKAERR